MLTYAIPDLHGRYDLLEAALARIVCQPPSRVIFLGDYIDRGPQSKQVLDRLMAGPPEGWEWIILRGNHEDMMRASLAGRVSMDWWFEHGGLATLKSFGIASVEEFNEENTAGLLPYLNWVANLPTIYVDQHRIFVHAGVDVDLTLEEQSDANLVWMRYLPGEGEDGHSGRHVVHGHHASALGAVRYPGRTNLDGMAYGTDILHVGVFDDDIAGGPIQIARITIK